MAPQTSQSVPTTNVYPAAPSTSAPADPAAQPWVPIPVALAIFLGVCFAYVLSYLLYRFVMARRRQSADDIPDTPDRGVSQFMNGTRLTLNLGNHKPTSLPTDKSPQIRGEDKPLVDSPHAAHAEVPISSPAGDLTSSPFIILMPSLSMHNVQALGEAPQNQDASPADTEPPTPLTVKVKSLPRDRAEAIALDPKLAPVQGPLRPLSMIPSPSPKKRMTLFGLGLKYPRGQAGDPAPDSEAR